MTPVGAPDLLATIVAATRHSVEVRAAGRPLVELERAAAGRRPRGTLFRSAIGESAPPPRVIAECKRRSPSRGVLRDEYDPRAVARAYAANGAAAISVVTEPAFFDGDLEHLRAVRTEVDVPLLRKDFIVTPYQLVEAREAGADAVLLIVGALDQESLIDMLAAADAHGLAALVEVHEETELERALAAGVSIVGVNSRNLRTLEVDLSVARRLVARIPDRVVAVAESGLKTIRDLDELQGLGYDAFLIGERFMTETDPGRALRELRSAGSGGGPS